MGSVVVLLLERPHTTLNTITMAFTVSSCCCYDLSTGSAIIAVLGLLASIYMTIAGWVYLGIFVQTKSLLSNYQSGPFDILIAFVAVLLVFGLLHLLFYSFLVHGTAKKQPGYVKAWLVFAYIFLVLDVVCILASAFLYNLFILIPTIIGLCIYIYFIMVVRSHHLILTAGNSEHSAKTGLEFHNVMRNSNPA